MRQLHKIPQLLIVASVLAACASTPDHNMALDDARAQYTMAQSDPQVVSLAPIELQRAGDALGNANQAWEHHDKSDKVNELAHIAKEKVEIARNVAHEKAAEASIANAAKQRDQLIIDQRTRDADRATMAAHEAENRAREANDRAQAANDRARVLEMQLMDLSAKKTERGMVVTLSDVLFNTDKSELNPGGVRTVQKLADILTKNPDQKILVEGFTDSTGTTSYNLDLSTRRANSVRDALLGMGITSDRIAARGLGKEYPVAGNDTASGRQLNRRVEIIFPNEVTNTVSQQ